MMVRSLLSAFASACCMTAAYYYLAWKELPSSTQALVGDLIDLVPFLFASAVGTWLVMGLLGFCVLAVRAWRDLDASTPGDAIPNEVTSTNVEVRPSHACLRPVRLTQAATFSTPKEIYHDVHA